MRLPPRSALLLIDVVNPFDFASAPRLLRQALPAARRMAALKSRALRAGLPVVYVNDNYGDWHADFAELVARCRRPGSRGRPFVELLAPEAGDYYVLKPLHSGFQSTSLEVLLDRLGVATVVLAGVAAHICVLFTAIDAYMLGLDVVIPSDCVASEQPRQSRVALQQMADVLKARVLPSRALVFPRRGARRGRSPGRSRARRSGRSPAPRRSGEPAPASRADFCNLRGAPRRRRLPRRRGAGTRLALHRAWPAPDPLAADALRCATSQCS